MTSFVEVPEFQKDLKKLKVNLSEDLKVFKKALVVCPTCLNGAVKIQGFGENFYFVFKVKKFRCKALNKGSKSGIRVIYTYHPLNDEIYLIAIYQKNHQENHDNNRIKRYLIKKEK